MKPSAPAINPFVRNLRSGELFETFLVTGVTTILLVRGYLALTGYPQLGGETLHIAHVLPGGLLMMVAIVLMLGFLNKEARGLAAVAGGIGFGLFIDELGKFITKDTNYFFEPTVALIYVVFVVLFLCLRWIEDRHATEQEYVVNAVESTKEVVLHDLDRAERKIALEYLKHGNRKDPTVQALRELLQRIQAEPTPEPTWFARLRHRLARRYRALIRKPWFNQAVIGAFVVSAAAGLSWALAHIIDHPSRVTFPEWGELLSSLAIGVIVVIGALQILGGSRTRAYETLQRAVLIYLFVTQFFIFYRAQFAGLVGLIGALVVLAALQYAIKQERYGS